MKASALSRVLGRDRWDRSRSIYATCYTRAALYLSRYRTNCHRLFTDSPRRPGAGAKASGTRRRELLNRGATILRDEHDAIEQLEALLRDAVKMRMHADVPLGAFLSGGIDSSTVVALMQAQSTRPVKTFSIGFHAAGYDEAQYAGGVAAHLHTDHTEFYVEPKHALELVPRLADWFDEPFADSSQIPALLISELTRKHVTVALSGDGGDELFAGYNRYLWAERFLRVADALPRHLHHPMAAALRALPPDSWTRLFRWFRSCLV